MTDAAILRNPPLTRAYPVNREAPRVIPVGLANSFRTRFLGLMFSASVQRRAQGAQGLLITRCSSVHTCFMRYPIDVIYLDDAGTVVGHTDHLKPWRIDRHRQRRARQAGLAACAPIHTLELPAGQRQALRIALGDRWGHDAFGHRQPNPAHTPVPHQETRK